MTEKRINKRLLVFRVLFWDILEKKTFKLFEL